MKVHLIKIGELLNKIELYAEYLALSYRMKSKTLNYKKPVYVFSLHDMKMAFEKGKYDVSDEMFLAKLKALLETRRKQVIKKRRELND